MRSRSIVTLTPMTKLWVGVFIVVCLMAAALLLAGPGKARSYTTCSIKQAPKVQYTCAKRAIHRGRTTYRFLRRHQEAGTTVSRRRVLKASLGLIRYGKWQKSLAQKRMVPTVSYWIAKQIRVATIIGRQAASDPWPICSDPIWDGASSWQVTVNCENGGNWLDSPGYYRCGLQFDPGWERKFGRLCP